MDVGCRQRVLRVVVRVVGDLPGCRVVAVDAVILCSQPQVAVLVGHDFADRVARQLGVRLSADEMVEPRVLFRQIADTAEERACPHAPFAVFGEGIDGVVGNGIFVGQRFAEVDDRLVEYIIYVYTRFGSDPVSIVVVRGDGTNLYVGNDGRDGLILIFVKHQSREVGSGQYAQFGNLPDGLYADLFFYLLLGQEIDLPEIIRFCFVEV